MTEQEDRTGTSRGARWAIVVVAVAALVVAFFALRGAGDDPEQASRPATATTQGQTDAQQPPTTEQPRSQAERPAIRVIRVRGGEPVVGVARLEVRKGERIRFRVVADADDEVHLHGYDVEKAVGPGRRAVFDVEATLEGRFEVELHGSGTQIAQVDVAPS